jgi:hypothetical protein
VVLLHRIDNEHDEHHDEVELLLVMHDHDEVLQEIDNDEVILLTYEHHLLIDDYDEIELIERILTEDFEVELPLMDDDGEDDEVVDIHDDEQVLIPFDEVADDHIIHELIQVMVE